jgi:hypothetical protein
MFFTNGARSIFGEFLEEEGMVIVAFNGIVIPNIIIRNGKWRG